MTQGRDVIKSGVIRPELQNVMLSDNWLDDITIYGLFFIFEFHLILFVFCVETYSACHATCNI